MARAPLKFRQTDVTRAVRAAQAAGLEVVRTEIAPDGRIVMIHQNDNVMPDATPNQWDEVYAQKQAAEVLPRLR